MTETKFLVFTECGGYQNSDPDVGHSVEEIACWLAKEGHVPVAWCEGEAMGGSTWLEDCRAESIAAGRTIEQIDGRYVPRGVPVEDKPAKSELPELVKHFLQRESIPQPTKERTRPALPWADSKPFDRFPGFVVVKSVPELGNPVLLAQGPFQRVNDGSDPHHGSAWLKVR
jgi:hypothetical protein